MMAENKMRVGIKYRVTKGNSDGSIFVGDVIMLDKDGDIVCDKTGWLEKNQLTPDVMDFEVEEADKNKMEAVAQLFGKKLGEEFKVRGKTQDYLMAFTETGLKLRQEMAYPELFENSFLRKLLTGEAVIVDD